MMNESAVLGDLVAHMIARRGFPALGSLQPGTATAASVTTLDMHLTAPCAYLLNNRERGGSTR